MGNSLKTIYYMFAILKIYSTHKWQFFNCILRHVNNVIRSLILFYCQWKIYFVGRLQSAVINHCSKTFPNVKVIFFCNIEKVKMIK